MTLTCVEHFFSLVVKWLKKRTGYALSQHREGSFGHGIPHDQRSDTVLSSTAKALGRGSMHGRRRLAVNACVASTSPGQLPREYGRCYWHVAAARTRHRSKTWIWAKSCNEAAEREAVADMPSDKREAQRSPYYLA